MLLENRDGNIVLAEWPDGTWLGRRVDTALEFDLPIDWQKDARGAEAEVVLTVFRSVERMHLKFLWSASPNRLFFRIIPQFDADTEKVDPAIRDAITWTLLCWFGISYEHVNSASTDRMIPSIPVSWKIPEEIRDRLLGPARYTPWRISPVAVERQKSADWKAKGLIRDSLFQAMMEDSKEYLVRTTGDRIRYLLRPYDTVYILEAPSLVHETWTLYHAPSLFGRSLDLQQDTDEIAIELHHEIWRDGTHDLIDESPDIVGLLERASIAIPEDRVESWIEEHAIVPKEILDISIWVSFGQLPPPLWGRAEFLAWVETMRMQLADLQRHG